MNTKIKIAVTGGCGYIGSHAIIDLLNSGYDVISVDSLANSSEAVLDGIQKITGKRIINYRIDLSVENSWREFVSKEKDIQGIIHFAALKAVGESVQHPLTYYKNNVGGLIEVLKWMKFAGIPYLIYSSSCTVYGQTNDLPVTEATAFGEATSPYGRTKQIGEWMLQDLFTGPEQKAISLRYFNPAGAHESALIGEAPTNPALNLVPVITETAIGKRDQFIVHGTNYNTPDGTCIRDYIHVMDLANAHTKALNYLMNHSDGLPFDAFNLGIGKGHSVLEMIHSFELLSGVKLNYQMGPRRPGDTESIYADNTKAIQLLDWKPTRNLDMILESAWKWEKNRMS